MSPSFSLASVPSVSPEPAYIAAAAATNVVAGEIAHEFHVELSEGVFVSPGSLHLINTFLDRLLFNFLSCAHSTSLGALRPAVTEVLRPRLAREAIAGADEELEEYLGGDSDEMNLINGEKAVGPWDLDVAWKRTRLRCMLYTRLGDMEEEEEEMFLEQDNLHQGGGQSGSHIQPAVAIFLTSVLEFIGEHALMIAAQAAYKRHEIRSQIENSGFRRITVEEVDMEKNALNSTLGRLWRSWRTSIRSPRASISRLAGVGPRGFRGFSVSSRSSMTTEGYLQEAPEEEIEKVPAVKAKEVELPDPSMIALPVTNHDIDEIEVPGFSSDLAQRPRSGRSESIVIHPGSHTHKEQYPEDDDLQNATPTAASYYQRNRSSSVPNSKIPVFIHQSYTPSENSFATPLEGSPQPKDLHQAQAVSIIDMSGNSVAVIGDYAIPKSTSAPTSPYGGSMLNAISASAAQGLAGQSCYHEEDSELDPTDGALQFTRNDYEIGEHEHSNRGSRVSAIGTIKNIQPPYEYPMTVSPLVGPLDHPVSGAVSPLDSEFQRHQVSPLVNDEDDEEDTDFDEEDDSDISNQSARAVKIPTSPATAGSMSAFTSPRFVTASMDSIVGSRSKPRNEEQEQDSILTRANQGRQRSREGPTKEENREAFVLPQAPIPFKQIDQISKPEESVSRSEEISRSDTDLRRWRAAEKAITATNLPPVRESFENKAITPIQTSPSKQYPVARKAIPPTSSPVSQKRQVSRISTDIESVTAGQRTVTTPVSAKESHSASRATDSSIRPANSVRSTIARNKSHDPSFTNGSVHSRTSVEGVKNSGLDRFSRSSTSNSDSHRDFDQLINSGTTLQYTLTSQSMREIEVCLNPFLSFLRLHLTNLGIT